MLEILTAGQIRSHMDAAVSLLLKLGWERSREDRIGDNDRRLPLMVKINHGKTCKAVVGPTSVTLYEMEGLNLIGHMESLLTYDVAMIRARAMDIGGQ